MTITSENPIGQLMEASERDHLVEKSRNKETISVSINSIRTYPQIRTVFSQEEIKELASSIQNIGLMQPILITFANGEEKTTETDNRAFVLIAGERRLMAHHYLVANNLKEFETIQARIWVDKNGRPLSVKRIIGMQVAENEARVPITTKEWLNYIEEIITKKPDTTPKQLVELLGMSSPWVSNILKVLKGDPEIKAKVAAGNMGLTTAYQENLKLEKEAKNKTPKPVQVDLGITNQQPGIDQTNTKLSELLKKSNTWVSEIEQGGNAPQDEIEQGEDTPQNGIEQGGYTAQDGIEQGVDTEQGGNTAQDGIEQGGDTTESKTRVETPPKVTEVANNPKRSTPKSTPQTQAEDADEWLSVLPTLVKLNGKKLTQVLPSITTTEIEDLTKFLETALDAIHQYTLRMKHERNK